MELKFKKNIKNKDMINIISFFVLQSLFIVPEIVTFTPLFRFIRYFQHPLIIFAIILYWKNYRNDKILILSLVFFTIYTISTLIHRGLLSSVLYNFERIFGIMIYYKATRDYDKKFFYQWTSNYWLFILILSTFLTIIKPDGLLIVQSETTPLDRKYFFLGVSNQCIPFFLVGITFSALYELTYKKRYIRTGLLLVCMWVNEMIFKSATSLLSCTIFTLGYLVLLLYSKFKRQKQIKNRRRKIFIVLSCVIIFLGHPLVVIGRIQEFFAPFIEGVLHKNVNLSTRTVIWDHAFGMIKDAWFLGYGAVENNNRYIFVGSSSFNAHNLLLQILLMGGIFLFVVFLVQIVFSVYNIVKCKDIQISYVVFILFITFFFASLTEVYSLNLLFIIFFICGFIGDEAGEKIGEKHMFLIDIVKKVNPYVGMDYVILRNNFRQIYSSHIRKLYVEREYKKRIGRELDWNNLQSYSEKMQYEKLYDLYSLKTQCTDKILVREFVEKRIGKEYLIPIYGVWKKFDDIDFSKLPNSFVLKTNHGSGSVVVIEDKSKMNMEDLRNKFRRWLKTKFQYTHFEMHYAGITPKIYAEKKLSFSDGIEDYKFLCFDGEPQYCWVDFDRFNEHKRKVYDMEWNLQNWNQYTYGHTLKEAPKPNNLNEMIEVARKLSKGFSHVRIDLYNVKDKIYFGEMTFTNGAGLEGIHPWEWDIKLGELWHLDIKKENIV